MYSERKKITFVDRITRRSSGDHFSLFESERDARGIFVKELSFAKAKETVGTEPWRELRNPSWQFLSRGKNFELRKKKRKKKEKENLMKRKAYLSGVVRNFDRYTPVMRRVEKLECGVEVVGRNGMEGREGMPGFVGQTLASSKMNFAASCAG